MPEKRQAQERGQINLNMLLLCDETIEVPPFPSA